MVNMTPSHSEQRSHSLAHPKWITQELIEQTKRVWSEALRREAAESEAIEILMSVRRLGEFAGEIEINDETMISMPIGASYSDDVLKESTLEPSYDL